MAKINDHKGSDWGGSIISRFQTCKRKHQLAEVYPHPDGGRGLQLLDAKQGTASDFGVIVHYGLQAKYLNQINDYCLYYNAEAPSEDDRFVLETAPMTYAEACAQAMHFAVSKIEGDWPGRGLFQDEVLSCLDQYFAKYETDDIKPTKAEHPFSVKIGEYIHTGIIDLAALWQDNECIVDHKTTSLPWDKFMKKWFDILSLKGYVYGHWKSTGNLVPILINGIRRKGNKALDCEFQREVIHYTEDHMKEFEDTVLFERGMMDHCAKVGFYPKSGDSCMEVWGECEFLRICRYPSEAMIKTFYKPRKV